MLYCVGEAVAQVEQFPLPALAEVPAHYPGLHPCRSPGKRKKPRCSSRIASLRQGCSPEEFQRSGICPVHVVDYEGFEHFRGTRKHLPPGKSLEGSGGHPGEARLGKAAQYILVTEEVDASLASYCSIGHRQQGGRHIGESYAPHINGCGEARHIADYAAAQCQHEGLAVRTAFKQDTAYLLHRAQGLLFFARLQFQNGRVEPESRHQMRNGTVADDENPVRAEGAYCLPQAAVIFFYIYGVHIRYMISNAKYTKKRPDTASDRSYIQKLRVLAANCSNARENLALDGLEQGTAAGGDVAYLVGKAELVDAGNGVTTADEGECTLCSGLCDGLAYCA